MSSSNGLKSTALKTMLGDQAEKKPVKLLLGPSSSTHAESSQRFTKSIKDRVKGRLSLGAKILQMGKTEKLFKQEFSVREGEQLLKAFHCCLFTTAGPIAGLLFITNDKLAFCSNKSVVKVSSPTRELLGFRYKVVIPLRKLKRVGQSHSVKKASQKYLQVVTMDDFDFWFMGFVSFKKLFKCLHHAVSQL